MLNTGALAGRTIFISGASRGIGAAIAVKCAADGANVVIAAKTATPHPKLPGTIYTVAEEIEKAGGKALPCVVDIRDDIAVEGAVQEAVAKFGGIDVCINNASAISLTGTMDTPLKRFDLMMGINARGTYAVTRACLPHLMKSSHPHVLNNAPPLNMNPIWFKNHTAYTMAKYGMSMCVLGMAEEFRDIGIGVNALWPATPIATAAVEMLGGDDLINASRKTSIMADAAYAILCRDPKLTTGNFYVDEDVVKAEGILDLDQYHNCPGTPLSADFFLGDEYQTLSDSEPAPATGGSNIPAMMESFKPLLTRKVMKKTGLLFSIDFSNDASESVWTFDLKNAGTITEGKVDSPDVVFEMSEEIFVKVVKGEINTTAAFMSGQMKIKGNLMEAMKLEGLFKEMRKKL